MYKLYVNLIKSVFPIYFLLIGSGYVYAQTGIGAGTFAFPASGQSTEQIQTDKFQCHNWAVSKANFDPTRDHTPPRTYSYSPPPSSSGSANRTDAQNAGRGAARGTVIGTITGSTLRGAVVGTATSVLFGKKKRKKKEKEEEEWQQNYQQQQQQQLHETEQYIQQGTDKYQRAYSLCMASRNYTVQ